MISRALFVFLPVLFATTSLCAAWPAGKYLHYNKIRKLGNGGPCFVKCYRFNKNEDWVCPSPIDDNLTLWFEKKCQTLGCSNKAFSLSLFDFYKDINWQVIRPEPEAIDEKTPN